MSNQKFFSCSLDAKSGAILFFFVFLLLGWYLFALTLGQVFSHRLVIFGLVIFGISLLITGFLFITRSSRDFLWAFLLCLIAAISLFFISVRAPSLFSGRDQGSISEAAYRLAQNGTLFFSNPSSNAFFGIYGPGTALNFPGFAYTSTGELVTQFPLGYTSYLAGFVSGFGLSGFALGNAFLFFFFLLALYVLLRKFTDPFLSFAGLLLAIFSFLPFWFAKFTLTENFALVLFLFLTLSLLTFLEERSLLSYTSLWATGILLSFSRIEGFALLTAAFIVMFFFRESRLFLKEAPFQRFVFPSLFFLFLLSRDFFLNVPYYTMIAKAFLKVFHGGHLTQGFSGFADAASFWSLPAVFFSYGLFSLFFFGAIVILFFVIRKRYLLLVPFFLALPTFIYLFLPAITPDHPWMLRRFLFSLFPLFLFYVILGLSVLSPPENWPFLKKKCSLIVLAVTLLLIVELPASLATFFFVDNVTLFRQLKQFSERFSQKDLVLLDGFTSGDGFTMLSGPAQYLLGKNMVYFFNPEDLKRLDRTGFERVFLVTPEENALRYEKVLGEDLVRVGETSFTLRELRNTDLTETRHRSPIEVRETKDIIFTLR